VSFILDVGDSGNAWFARTIEVTVKKCAASTGLSIHATVDNLDGIVLPTEMINTLRTVPEGLKKLYQSFEGILICADWRSQRSKRRLWATAYG
jgi:hypothetical protein